MPTYYSHEGRVLVVRYPIKPRTASDGPWPPIRIGPAPQGQVGTNDYIAYTVWEPYEEQALLQAICPCL
jgi:hypothetical protein